MPADLSNTLFRPSRRYCPGSSTFYINFLVSRLDYATAIVLELKLDLDPEIDPELSQYGIEFARRVLLRRPEVLISQPANVLEFLFTFAMSLLDGNEPLPKTAAAEFWVRQPYKSLGKRRTNDCYRPPL
jgi:hypothetical protein